jgi:hypothetical protein
MEGFSWRMKGLAKRVDPSAAGQELQRIQNVYGSITPEILVGEAKKRKSPLHNIFEWDDTKAAANYRLQQARILLNNIRVTVVTDGESKEISVYEVTSVKEGYKSIDTFTSDDIDFVRTGIERDLFYLKKKLELYKQFDKVLEYINCAIEAL